MRSTVITVALLAFTNAAQGAFYLFHNDAYGKHVRITVSDDMLKRTPKWDKKSDNPPLSARKAMRLAEKVKLQLDRRFKPKYKFKFGAATIHPGKDDRWYWVVYYEEVNPYRLSGIASSLTLVVLMDGQVLHGYPKKLNGNKSKPGPQTGKRDTREKRSPSKPLEPSPRFR